MLFFKDKVKVDVPFVKAPMEITSFLNRTGESTLLPTIKRMIVLLMMRSQKSHNTRMNAIF
jgi:hypothetical protein